MQLEQDNFSAASKTTINFKTALSPRTPVALAAINITPQHATCIIPCDASTAAASSTPAGADHTLNLWNAARNWMTNIQKIRCHTSWLNTPGHRLPKHHANQEHLPPHPSLPNKLAPQLQDISTKQPSHFPVNWIIRDPCSNHKIKWSTPSSSPSPPHPLSTSGTATPTATSTTRPLMPNYTTNPPAYLCIWQ